MASQEEHAKRSRSKRFAALLREQEIASRAPGAELSDEAKRSAEDFERQVTALNELVDTENDTLMPPLGPPIDLASMRASNDQMHVFGPGTYTERFQHHDGGQPTVDLANGRLSAYNYTTGPARFTVAQLGVKLRPTPRYAS